MKLRFCPREEVYLCRHLQRVDSAEIIFFLKEAPQRNNFERFFGWRVLSCMIRQSLVFLIFCSCFSAFGQEKLLVLGNYQNLCLPDSTIVYADSLPDTLDHLEGIFLFSGSTSDLSSVDLDRIEAFVDQGGGLYLGADNWPLQAESNQVTYQLYKKESFGNYDASVATSNQLGKMRLSDLDTIPAGRTTAAFPLDYRLTVEAWIEDQPFILSGVLGSGKIVIDGGYSRFYCSNRNENSDAVYEKIRTFLKP